MGKGLRRFPLLIGKGLRRFSLIMGKGLRRFSLLMSGEALRPFSFHRGARHWHETLVLLGPKGEGGVFFGNNRSYALHLRFLRWDQVQDQQDKEAQNHHHKECASQCLMHGLPPGPWYRDRFGRRLSPT